MEYLAFGLLAIGVLFILIGMISGGQKENRSKPVSEEPLPQPTQTNIAFVQDRPPMVQPQGAPISGTPGVSTGNLHIHNGERNPLFFQKQGYLYIDQSRQNNYDGNQSHFDILDTAKIHRYGPGQFSYDGFGFIFDHEGGKEVYSTAGIEHVSIYPNCVALTLKSNGYTVLIFVDSTREIQKILETFRIQDAS